MKSYCYHRLSPSWLARHCTHFFAMSSHFGIKEFFAAFQKICLLILIRLGVSCSEIRAVVFRVIFICFLGLFLQNFLRFTLEKFLLARVD
jgi:hypothetical protein